MIFHERILMRTLSLLMTVCLAAGSAFGDEVIREESIAATLATGDTVAIFNINGDITVEGGASDEVEVVYTITCEDQEELDAVEVLCDLSSGISCEVEYDNDWNEDHHGEVEFQVRVPGNLALSFELANVNGDVSISSARGTLSVQTVNGDVSTDEFKGEAVIELVNGSITVTDTPELSEVSIVNGNIICRVDELESDLTLSSINGGIRVDLTANAVVEIETISGDIVILDSFNAIIRENIVGASASFGEGEYTIHVSTVSGDIEIND